MRLSAFLLFIAAAHQLAGAANLSGVVVDRSGRGVASALVECAGISQTTDNEGRFHLDSAGPCEARISRSGFEAARVELVAGKSARVELVLATQSERVVVSATRTPVSLEESGVSATILNRSDLEIRQSPAVLDVLRDVPGMSIVNTSRRGGITSVFTRGGGSTATLVLLDGVPLNEPGGQIDLANLTTAGLDRIEAIRGPESALFGAEAASGVVQLFTARGDSESAAPHGRLVYERGNFQTDHWTAGVSGGFASRIDYSLTADQFHTVGMFPNDYYRNTNGTANLGWRVSPNTEVRGIYRQFAAEGGNPNMVAYGIFDRESAAQNRMSTLLLRVDDVRSSRFAQRFSYGYNRLRYRITDDSLDGPFPVAALVRTTADGQVYFDRMADPSSTAPAGLTLVQRSVTLYPFPNSNSADRRNAEYQGTFTHQGGTLVFGYEYERQSGVVSATQANRDNQGGYVHDQFRLGRRLFFTGGFRLEHSSAFGRKFAPRGSVTLALAGEHGVLTSTHLRFSAGRGITEPSLLQNYARESFYVGNAALRPERTSSYELGLVQEFWRKRLRAEFTAFRNSFEDLIVYASATYPDPGTWRNIDRSWGRGFEAIVTARPFKFVQVSTEWTRLYTRITETRSTSALNKTGQPLLRRPRNEGSAWISVAPRRWTLVAGGRFTGERQDSDFLFGLTRNPGYGTMYFNGSYNLTRHITPYFRIDNLLNERYQEVLGFTSLTRNGFGGVRVTW